MCVARCAHDLYGDIGRRRCMACFALQKLVEEKGVGMTHKVASAENDAWSLGLRTPVFHNLSIFALQKLVEEKGVGMTQKVASVENDAKNTVIKRVHNFFAFAEASRREGGGHSVRHRRGHDDPRAC